jgi:hypothetical protein
MGRISEEDSRMKKNHQVVDLRFKGKNLLLIIDGDEKSFPLNEISSLLANATDIERNTFEISPSGYGIHWPLLDEDLSIDGLMGVTHSPVGKKHHDIRVQKNTQENRHA